MNVHTLDYSYQFCAVPKDLLKDKTRDLFHDNFYKGKKVNHELFSEYKIEYSNKNMNNSDFVSISMGDYFAVTEKVKNEIQELKESNIDFVPVKDQFERTLYLLNPLTVIDNYDYENIDEDSCFFIDQHTKVCFKETENLPPVFLCNFYKNISRVIYCTDKFKEILEKYSGTDFTFAHKEYIKRTRDESNLPVLKMEKETEKKFILLMNLATNNDKRAESEVKDAAVDMLGYLYIHEKEWEEIQSDNELSSYAENYKYINIPLFQVMLISLGYSHFYKEDSTKFFIRNMNFLTSRWNKNFNLDETVFKKIDKRYRYQQFSITAEKNEMACIFNKGLVSYFPVLFKLTDACKISKLLSELNIFTEHYIESCYGYISGKNIRIIQQEKAEKEDEEAPSQRPVLKSRVTKYSKFVKEFTNNNKQAVSLIKEAAPDIIAFYQNHKDDFPFSMMFNKIPLTEYEDLWNFTKFRNADYYGNTLQLDNAFLFHVLEYCGYTSTYYCYKKETFVTSVNRLLKKFDDRLPDSLEEEKEITKYLVQKGYAVCKINKCGRSWEPFNPDNFPFKLIISKKEDSAFIAQLLTKIGEKNLEWYGYVKPVSTEIPYKDKLIELSKLIAEDFLITLTKKFPKDKNNQIEIAFIEWYYNNGSLDISLVSADAKQFEEQNQSEHSGDYNYGSSVNRYSSKLINRVEKLAVKADVEEYNGGSDLLNHLMFFVNNEMQKLDFSSVNTTGRFKIMKSYQYD